MGAGGPALYGHLVCGVLTFTHVKLGSLIYAVKQNFRTSQCEIKVGVYSGNFFFLGFFFFKVYVYVCIYKAGYGGTPLMPVLGRQRQADLC